MTLSKRTINAHGVIKHYSISSLLWVVFLTACCLVSPNAFAQKRVLVIHSYQDNLPWSRDLRLGIDTEFAKMGLSVDVLHEFLDAKRHPAMQYGSTLLELLEKKHEIEPPDLIMISDDPGLRLLLKYRHRFFSNTPVVFLGINKIDEDLIKQPNMVGAFEIHNTVDTVLGALAMTEQSKLVVINDTTETGQANLGGIEQLKLHPRAPSQIEVVNDLVPSEIGRVFNRFPPEWPVLVLGQLREDNELGSLLSFEQTAKILSENTPNPLFCESIVFLGHGVIGGNVLDPNSHAAQAVSLAMSVLAGENINSLKPITHAKSNWIFDWVELKKFGFQTERLPRASRLVNVSPSFYEQNKLLVWLISAAFFTALIVILTLGQGIRRRSATEEVLRENQQRYKDFSEAGDDVFWEMDDALKFQHVSGNNFDLAGVLDEKSFGEFILGEIDHIPTLEFDRGTFLNLVANHKPIRDFIFRTRVGDKAIQIYKFNGKPLFDENGKFTGYRGIRREITDEYNLAERIAFQASYDWLTGLINRREFDSRLQETMRAYRVTKKQAVLCYIDLDRFKMVNDSVGHIAGDQLLTQVAISFKSCTRETDIVGRLGGDEFGLILSPNSLFEAEAICQKIIETIRTQKFEWEGRIFTLGCSIGITPILDNSSSAVDLLMRADMACYRAKDLGRNCLFVDAPGDVDLDSHQSIMRHISDVDQSIHSQKFHLFKQQILNLTEPNSGSQHFEVLLRIQDEQENYGSPEKLILTAERYGVISSIDSWVLETVIDRCMTMHPDTHVSVNLSGMSLVNEKFIDKAFELIKKADFPVEQLCFEITETAVVSNLDVAKHFINKMRALGVKFALDDFGSGQASFGYLKALPVDFLKIDGSLIKNIANEPSNQVMVRSINEIAHIMGMKTIAEFVENQDTLACVRALGIDYAQGYAIEKPNYLRLESLATA